MGFQVAFESENVIYNNNCDDGILIFVHHSSMIVLYLMCICYVVLRDHKCKK